MYLWENVRATYHSSAVLSCFDCIYIFQNQFSSYMEVILYIYLGKEMLIMLILLFGCILPDSDLDFALICQHSHVWIFL